MIHQIKNNTGIAKSYGFFVLGAGSTESFWDDVKLEFSSNIESLLSELYG